MRSRHFSGEPCGRLARLVLTLALGLGLIVLPTVPLVALAAEPNSLSARMQQGLARQLSPALSQAITDLEQSIEDLHPLAPEAQSGADLAPLKKAFAVFLFRLNQEAVVPAEMEGAIQAFAITCNERVPAVIPQLVAEMQDKLKHKGQLARAVQSGETLPFDPGLIARTTATLKVALGAASVAISVPTLTLAVVSLFIPSDDGLLLFVLLSDSESQYAGLKTVFMWPVTSAKFAARSFGEIFGQMSMLSIMKNLKPRGAAARATCTALLSAQNIDHGPPAAGNGPPPEVGQR